MSQDFAGQVAFVTGAARGQGRSHALRLAEGGADVIVLDLCKPVDTVPYALAERADLEATAERIRGLGREVVVVEADVRDLGVVTRDLATAVERLGRLDIVVANAGIVSHGTVEQMGPQAWRDVIDVNLTGVWNTAKAAIPHLVASGGGSMVLISSVAGVRGLYGLAHYAAAKHGVLGLMKALALELGHYSIRVNAVLPTTVDTPMVANADFYARMFPGVENPSLADLDVSAAGGNALPGAYVEASDVTDVVEFLASARAATLTGVSLPVDLGRLLR